MKKVVIQGKGKPFKQSNSVSSLESSQLCIMAGEVTENNDDGTCNVLLRNGYTSNNMRILSTIYPTKGTIYGGISYPQVGAYVNVIFPKNNLQSGFILPGHLDNTDDDVNSELLSGGDKTILPGGWEYSYNQETGQAIFSNGDFSLDVDPENENFSLTDFQGNTFANNGETLEINGTTAVAREGDGTTSSATYDAVFWSWVTTISAAVNALSSGSVPTVPSTLTGAISEGSDKVKVG
ncbi:MAG: hypothetical protein PQJ59_16555 [Spirochaetales bacterium]|nr:hypothetical protein [Spirochaetales bacterium]